MVATPAAASDTLIERAAAESGLGRELGPDAPYAFTEEENVFIAPTEGKISDDRRCRA